MSHRASQTGPGPRREVPQHRWPSLQGDIGNGDSPLCPPPSTAEGRTARALRVHRVADKRGRKTMVI
ncbi:hypothetical protein MHYP_G00109250 [Metynnis hypsauchen]